MGSGTGSPCGGGRTVGARAAIAALIALLGGGCATLDAEALLVEREAAMERWSACVGRHVDEGRTSLDAIELTRAACDGYRRDVAATFAPHLEPRVQTRLGARERRRVVRERVGRAALGDEPLSAGDRLRERVDRMLRRTAASFGDG